MHILMIQAGMPLYLSERIAALSRRPGVRVTVATASSEQVGRKDEAHPLDAQAVRHISLRRGVLDDVRSWELLGRLKDIVAQIRPDVLYAGGLFPAYLTAALLFARQVGIPTLAFSASTAYEPRRMGVAGKLARRAALGLVDCLLTPGERAWAYSRRLGMNEARMISVGNPVRNEWYQREATKYAGEAGASFRARWGLPEEPYLLFVGRFTEGKNILRLFEAYALAAARRTMPPLVFVGDSGGRQRVMVEHLVSEARKTGLEKRLAFPGYFDAAKLAAAYAGARALVLPSLSETWGLVVNEAMACGVPALVSERCGCAPELVEKGVSGWTFDPLNVEAIAVALEWARDFEPSDAGRLLIRRKVEAHTIERYVDGFLAGCRRVLK